MTTDLETLSEISQAAVVGGGVIGGGWAARLVLNGIDVRLFDPSPDAERRVNEVVENADCAHSRLTLAPATARGRLEFVDSVAQAVTAAGFIQESVPERLSLKQSILGEIDAHAPSNALICSSTSGLMPTKLQAHMAHPERMMVGHPFNPVYLLPLVEICGGVKTSMDSKRRAAAFYESIGMRPLILRKEIDAFIAENGRAPSSLEEAGSSLASQGVNYSVQGDSAYILILTIGKVFLYDLGELEDLYRVASLVGLAISLLLVSLAYQRFVFRERQPKKKESNDAAS